MARYIDADKLGFQLRHRCKGDCRMCEYATFLADNCGLIEQIPTADVVEVVRCKDCVFNVANMEKDPLDATDYSDITCSYFMTDGMTENDFCSYGKRLK